MNPHETARWAQRRNNPSSHSPKRFWTTDSLKAFQAEPGLFHFEGSALSTAAQVAVQDPDLDDGGQTMKPTSTRPAQVDVFEADERQEVDLPGGFIPGLYDRRMATRTAALRRTQAKPEAKAE